MSVAAIYEGWSRIQDRLVSRLPQMTSEHLGVRATAESWPIWALVAHIAGARWYWLCFVCAEPGADKTPFGDSMDEGWEDRLDVPRGPSELLNAVTTTWEIVESCLDRWTPDMLAVTFPRVRNGQVQRHSRESVLARLVMHDAFHTGEISLLLGQHGLPSLDPWEPQPL